MLDREAVAVVLLVAFVAIGLTPRNGAALAGLAAVLVSPLVLLALRPRAERSVDQGTLRVLGAFGVAVGVLTLASLLARDPRVSLFGMPLQHNGTLLWMGLAVLMYVVVSRSRLGDLGRVARAGAVLGAVLAVAAVADRFGLIPGVRIAGDAYGILEHPHSLTQVLVVSLACAIAWAAARRGTERAVAMSCSSLCLVGLVVGWTRAAWVGAAGGAVIVIVYALARRRHERLRVVAAVLGVLAVLAALGAFWLLLVADGPRAPQWLVRASNGRTIIWTSAFVRTAQSPAIGQGMAQFTAWGAWKADPGVTMTASGTNDPHNVVLSWLVGGGVVGLAAFLAAGYAGLWGLFRVLDERVPTVSTAAMVAGVLAWWGSLMFGWITPIGGLLAAVVAGVLLPSATTARIAEPALAAARRAGPVLAAAAFSVIALGVTILSWPVVTAEYVNVGLMDSGTSRSEDYAIAAEATGDAWCAELALDAYLDGARGDSPDREAYLVAAQRLAPIAMRGAAWHAGAALAIADFVDVQRRMRGTLDWGLFERAIDAGRLADPASGLWDYLGAARAREYGREQDAVDHAKRALEYPQTVKVRRWLLGIAQAPR